MLAEFLVNLALTVLVLTALVITCAAMIPPRPPKGPQR
jgi:hypothetical protein